MTYLPLATFILRDPDDPGATFILRDAAPPRRRTRKQAAPRADAREQRRRA